MCVVITKSFVRITQRYFSSVMAVAQSTSPCKRNTKHCKLRYVHQPTNTSTHQHTRHKTTTAICLKLKLTLVCCYCVAMTYYSMHKWRSMLMSWQRSQSYTCKTIQLTRHLRMDQGWRDCCRCRSSNSRTIRRRRGSGSRSSSSR